MDSNNMFDLLIRKIQFATGLNQGEIAERIGYKRETLSRAKKDPNNNLIPLLEKEFKQELAQMGRPAAGDLSNPERALLVALLRDYAALRAHVMGEEYEDVKADLRKKAKIVLDDLDSWLPEEK
jgi:transcriptional regulator with XRE-family HTH domain